MPFQRTVDIHYRIARFIKARQQFVDHNNDFRRISFLKSVDEIAFVFFCRAVLVHHLFPKGFFGIGIGCFFISGFFTFAVIG
ncbi:hypothetical protein Barb7_01906 [Bacteroidales bacterium Barb7]|nr:hypothetical protein Barb7_01906 [Bacteroidales bacterium Barb7]